MRAIDRLMRDHKILRSKLDVVEAVLKMGPSMWYVLREVCFTLSRQLRDHIKREEELVLMCRKSISWDSLSGFLVEHRDEREHMRSINHLFVKERDNSIDQIQAELSGLIDGLRRHMNEEEREVFPILERELTVFECTKSDEVAGYHLQECMTVNHVVHDYPASRMVFDSFFINVQLEGSNCIDEVAWRHGMDSRELLKHLEDAIGKDITTSMNVYQKRELCEK